MPATSYPKAIGGACQSTFSLTKVMLDWKPDKLAHNAPSQSELWEARQAIPGFK